ncbi:MAG: hypothetical protein PVG39_02230 [Desulfobacteraceae bacterium]|jgi:hypothetical protein
MNDANIIELLEGLVVVLFVCCCILGYRWQKCSEELMGLKLFLKLLKEQGILTRKAD